MGISYSKCELPSKMYDPPITGRQSLSILFCLLCKEGKRRKRKFEGRTSSFFALFILSHKCPTIALDVLMSTMLCLPKPGPPVIEPFSFPRFLEEGSRAKILCSVIKGDPPITIRWLKDGRPLTTSPMTVGVSISTLDEFSSAIVMSKVSLGHRGNYTCIASNAASSSNYTAEAVVYGKYRIYCLDSLIIRYCSFVRTPFLFASIPLHLVCISRMRERKANVSDDNNDDHRHEDGGHRHKDGHQVFWHMPAWHDDGLPSIWEKDIREPASILTRERCGGLLMRETISVVIPRDKDERQNKQGKWLEEWHRRDRQTDRS